MVKRARLLLLAASATLVAAPAFAGGFWNNKGWGHPGSSSTSGGSTSGGMPSSSTSSSSTTSGSATPVPEPSDAVLLLMGAAGVVIGRKLHARAKRKP